MTRRPRRHPVRLRHALAALVLLAIAPTTPAAADPIPWRHGVVQPKGDAGFWFMAAEGGFAARQGLALQMLPFNSDTLMLKALLAGALDSFEGSPIGPMVAGSKGADVKILGCAWPKLTYSLFARTGTGVTTLAGQHVPAKWDPVRREDMRQNLTLLKGRTIGISAPGSLPDIVGRAMLREAGIPPEAVHVVMAGSDPERVRAVVAGTVDAAIATSDFAARRELNLVTLARAAELLPDFVRVCTITRGDLVRTRRPDLVRLLAAEMASYRHALADREGTIALARRIAGLAPDDPTPVANFEEVVREGAVDPAAGLDMPQAAELAAGFAGAGGEAGGGFRCSRG